jgi:hypothetical protein
MLPMGKLSSQSRCHTAETGTLAHHGWPLSRDRGKSGHESQISYKQSNVVGVSAHACNPSDSGGRDQEEHGSKPAFERPHLENTHHHKKKGWGVSQGLGPEFKPRHGKKQKQTKAM